MESTLALWLGGVEWSVLMNPSDKKTVQSGDRSYAATGVKVFGGSQRVTMPEFPSLTSAAKGPGTEDGDHTEATMPQGEGADPKRNTLLLPG